MLQTSTSCLVFHTIYHKNNHSSSASLAKCSQNGMIVRNMQTKNFPVMLINYTDNFSTSIYFIFQYLNETARSSKTKLWKLNKVCNTWKDLWLQLILIHSNTHWKRNWQFHSQYKKWPNQGICHKCIVFHRYISAYHILHTKYQKQSVQHGTSKCPPVLFKPELTPCRRSLEWYVPYGYTLANNAKQSKKKCTYHICMLHLSAQTFLWLHSFGTKTAM